MSSHLKFILSTSPIYKDIQSKVRLLQDAAKMILKEHYEGYILSIYNSLDDEIKQYNGINYSVIGNLGGRILIYVFNLIKLDGSIIEINKCFYKSTGTSRGSGKDFWIPTTGIETDGIRIKKEEDSYFLKYDSKIYVNEKNYNEVSSIDIPLLKQLIRYGCLINKDLALTSKILYTIDNFESFAKPITFKKTDFTFDKEKSRYEFSYLNVIQRNNIPIITLIISTNFETCEREYNERLKIIKDTQYSNDYQMYEYFLSLI